MKKVILGILREIAIGLGILVILAAVVVLTFKDQLPYDEEIRKGEEYAKVNMKDYSVSSNDRTSEITAVTITHEANANQIVEAEDEVRIQTGKYTPFANISNTSDLPTEKVGVKASIPDDTKTSEDGNESNTEDGQNATGNQSEKLDYPNVGDELVSEIEEDQKESSESAATRRFNTEE